MGGTGGERLIASLIELAGRVTGDRSPAPVVLADRPDGLVVQIADVVVKAHPPGTDPDRLAARLRIAAAVPLTGVLLAPLRLPGGDLTTVLGDRLVTAWPAGEPVDPGDPEAAPWQPAGQLLARLHRVPWQAAAPSEPAPSEAPPGGAPARVARALDRLATQAGRHPAADPVRGALATLPPWAHGGATPPAGRPRTLTHGDWHLGQLVRVPHHGWLLVDVDDLGHGDPAWDLARPAAWYATGMMAAADWRRLLDAYRGAGGVAVPAMGDPWPALDTVARALVVQMAALAVAAASLERRSLDETEKAMVETCQRIAEQDPGAGSRSGIMGNAGSRGARTLGLTD